MWGKSSFKNKNAIWAAISVDIHFELGMKKTGECQNYFKTIKNRTEDCTHNGASGVDSIPAPYNEEFRIGSVDDSVNQNFSEVQDEWNSNHQ